MPPTTPRRASCWLLLLAGLSFFPNALPAAGTFRTIEPLVLQAQDFEKDGKWVEACRCYDELLRKDRDQLEYRAGYQRCLRRFHLARRHRDPAFAKALAKLTPTQALDVYEQVLTAVSNAYADRPKAELAVLFRHGVEELRFALDEPAFVKAYLNDGIANREALLQFRSRLDAWLSRQIATRIEARDEVLAIALAAKAAGLAPKQSILVPAFALEFACGGCNALDEYTLFLTPGHSPSTRTKPGPSVRCELLSENFSSTPGEMSTVGLLTISQFQESTLQEVNETLLDLSAKGANGLILDLRGNPGGLFKAAVNVAELFVGEGVIVYGQGQIKEYNRPFEARGGHTCQMPIVVLVDGETASAAEVLAGALKDLGRARVVGQATFGKGSIQAVIPLDRGPLDKTPAGIRLTVAKLLSPAKQPYTGRGVAPDRPVEGDSDAILSEGKAEIRRLLNMMPMAPQG